MEEAGNGRLIRELKLKRLQFNSISEFSSTLYSSFDIDHIIRVFFSTIMGQLGVSRIFLYDRENDIFRKRGFSLSGEKEAPFAIGLNGLKLKKEVQRVEELPEKTAVREKLLKFRIHYLIRVESGGETVVMGLGLRFNRHDLGSEDLDLAAFVARFAMIAVNNTIMVNRIIESQRIEHEIGIARDIQHSLLPQEIPPLENFDLCVEYRPIHEVGGDYYDILRRRRDGCPILIADVEGKGLPAALLAASSQAVFHVVNDLFLSSSSRFMAKANSLICDFTHCNRFITVFWMLVDGARRRVTYVNAGHEPPFRVDARGRVHHLSCGGFLAGFMPDAEYEQEELEMQPGEVIVAFTDGVVEVEDAAGNEFGRKRLEELTAANRTLCARDLTDRILAEIDVFAGGCAYRDDFTLLVLKAHE
ncbi:MAG TPA: hypothetical protein ENN40_06780 [Candidatus Aminicenantes bacterium]|nr:hypothetical protein [Candidatus Aminicenantes bacterium]